MKIKGKRYGERGFTLTEMMISAALFFLLVAIGSRATFLGEFWKKKAEVDHTLINAKVHFIQKLDCNTSLSVPPFGMAAPGCDFDASTCTAGEDGKIRGNNFIALNSKVRNPNRQRIVMVLPWKPSPLKGPSNTSSYGRELDIRAGCGCCSYCVGGKGLFVEYRRLTPTPDPINEFRPLFGERQLRGIGMPLACVVP